MKAFIAVIALVAAVAQAGVIPATTLVRTPSLDSAVIKSDRLGGNFAYSSIEGHAYTAVSPVVQNVLSPIGVSYHANPIATPVNLVHQQVVVPQYLPNQILATGAVFPGTSIISPVAPGVISPAYPIETAVPVSEQVTTQEEVKPEIVEQPAAPAAEDTPVVSSEPQEIQSDDAVSVESA